MPTKKMTCPTRTATCPLPPGKREVLDTTLVEFAGRTYNVVSKEPLAECAGLYKAGINAYFKSKEEIFHALLERTTKQLCDFQGWLPDEELTLPELVDAYLDRLYATFESPTTVSIYRLLLTESARAPELVKRWHDEVARGLRRRAQLIIQRNIDRGIVRPGVLTEHFYRWRSLPHCYG